MMPGSAAIFRVGTSNIVVPGTKQSFPDAFRAGSRLTYYASLFNSLEINSSFYKIPMPATFKRWSEEVPADFKFTVKLWRGITHAKALAFAADDIDIFMKSVNCTDNAKKGCLLIQFPASITQSFTNGVEEILKRVQKNDPAAGWQKCVEFRHSSWYQQVVYSMLDKYKASLVLHDMPASKISALHTKANVAFLRFHGVAGDYKGNYEQELLQSYSVTIKDWMKQGKEVYAYFNNTIGNAYENAKSLRQLVAGV